MPLTIHSNHQTIGEGLEDGHPIESPSLEAIYDGNQIKNPKVLHLINEVDEEHLGTTPRFERKLSHVKRF